MTFNWYNLFNLTAFNAENLVSRTLVVDLEGKGETTFLIVKGNEVSILYDGTLYPTNFLNENPYIENGCAVYVDASENVWFGFEN